MLKQEKHIAYISVGSNIKDKKKNLKKAINLLNELKPLDVIKISSFYKTAPQNYKDQDWFVNAALKIKTFLSPLDLLKALKTIEKKIDKKGKAFRFGPRMIDLDIIYYDDLIFKANNLEIPHPRMHERCFVLVPICDIGKNIIHPIFKCKSDELLKKIQGVQKVILLKKEN